MKVRLLIGVCVLVLAGGRSMAQQLPPDVPSKVDSEVKAALQRFAVPGAAIMVVRDGKVVFVRAYGERDVQHHLPVNTDTSFEIGSITKQFTVACILQLQEAGKLQIDQPLSSYLPDAPHAKEVTLRQLLSHTSGMHDYLDGPSEQVVQLSSHPISYHDLLSRVASLPLDFPPGSQWSYSNTNYLLLGKVIEAVSGESYPDYLQHHILSPLHMKNTHTMAEENRLQNMAIGYRHREGKLEPSPPFDASWGGAAGFLISTLQDLSHWDGALRSGKVVSMPDYQQMTTAYMTSKNGSADYGLGLFVDSVYEQPRIGHTGGSWGFTTADEYFPAQLTRVIAFTNSGDSPPEAGEVLTNIVFADLYPDLATKAETSAPNEDAKVTQTVRDAFRELQTGSSYAHFSARLQSKMTAGSGARFATGLGPYGAATMEIFKAIRHIGDDLWYDYILQFGPGVFIPFKVKIGRQGEVTSFSIG